MSQRELRSLSDFQFTVAESRLRSGQTEMGNKLEEEVAKLKRLLEETQAELSNKERQLAEAEATFSIWLATY